MNKNFSELSLGASVYIIVAVIALAMGVYGVIRTTSNFLIFEKYPVSNGGIGMMFGGGYYQTENDCLYVRSYYDEKGVGMRSPSEYELTVETEEKERCLSQVAESRKTTKVNDIGGSLLSLLVGAGLFYSRRFLFKD